MEEEEEEEGRREDARREGVEAGEEGEEVRRPESELFSLPSLSLHWSSMQWRVT